ncbi:MAG: carbamoyl-phosphate synthase large subunit, partial [Gaiellales bacterium]
MPRRDDLHTIAVIGSGPIVIGQACEFDYSGTQALKVLREEGYRTVLINSNPATIMTDPGWADRTYLEPLDVEGVAAVLRRERPDALLPTLGGQTALNLSIELAESGILDELGIELIGASREAIHRAEDRQAFAEAMGSIGLRVPRSAIIHTLAEAEAAFDAGFVPPVVIRPAFTLGGHGGGFARDEATYLDVVARGLRESPISQVLLEESVEGWGEFELEVIRDRLDNVVIICSIENIDPMGVHTGDSICVAPSMTLSDREYQTLRDAAAAVIRVVGVETGGSNVQFALNRETGELVVIEMNPRVSRSSALASKATGYPIAKVATRLAIGYTLDEIPNDITGTTPASFEPTIDYVVVKAPRFAFEKFPGADGTLTTQMKSVGEAMGIGRTFCEAMGKTLRSRELDGTARSEGEIGTPRWDRLDALIGRMRAGESPAALSGESGIHPWFCDELARTVALEHDAAARGLAGFEHESMR